MHKEELSTKLKFRHNYSQVVERADIPMLNNVTPELADITGKVKEAVRCDRCGTYHLTKETDDIRFLTLVGNLHANDGGGLLGNGNWDANGVTVYHFCPGCLIEDIKKMVKRSNGDVPLCELRPE